MTSGDQSLLRAAAAGVVEAQREFVSASLDLLNSGQCDPILGHNSLLIWARIAAAHGHAEDRQMLAGCLCNLSDTLRRAGHEDLAVETVAEAIVILEELADEGNELGAECINSLIENLPPQVALAAKNLKESAQ
ncbi:hypothetical protein VVT58_01965 [Sphingobium sp. SJ10-10]|uniref:hypothetical protein n=1 Tax=Sphingobium sp. SJ10-10 TaxID=3114999 RepID=UPI002E19AD32|nr:hypothetical protein [Sphingobium sp. SJ10-10]